MTETTLQICGYDVYIGKSRYVENKLLDQAHFRGPVEEQLKVMLEHPDAPMFLQRSGLHGNLSAFRRARILDTHRLYIRIHEPERCVVIAAFVGRADIKRDEKSGALDFHFIDTLLRHEILGYAPIERLYALQGKAGQDLQDRDGIFHYKSTKTHYKFQDEPIDENAAMQLVFCNTRHRASSNNPLINYVLNKIQNHWSGRILADVIADGLAADVDDLKKKRLEVAAYLKKVDLPWKVLYDALSGKLMIIPLDEIRFYATGMRGAHFMLKGRS